MRKYGDQSKTTEWRKNQERGVGPLKRGPYNLKAGMLREENKELLEKNKELESQVKRLTDQVEELTRDMDAMGKLITILKGDAGPDGDGGLGCFEEGVSSGEGFGIGNGWFNGESGESFNKLDVNAANALICLHHSPMKQNPTYCSPNHPMPGH